MNSIFLFFSGVSSVIGIHGRVFKTQLFDENREHITNMAQCLWFFIFNSFVWGQLFFKRSIYKIINEWPCYVYIWNWSMRLSSEDEALITITSLLNKLGLYKMKLVFYFSEKKSIDYTFNILSSGDKNR